MKKSAALSSLIGLSIAANVALLAAVVRPSHSSTAPKPLALDREGPTLPARSTSAAAAGETPGKSARLPAWPTLDRGDPRRFAAQLRELGFSNGEARAILETQLAVISETRWAELGGRMEEAPYWKVQPWAEFPYMDQAATAEMRRLDSGNRRLLNELFGPDNSPGAMALDTEARLRFGNLPPEKIEALQAIDADYDDLETAARTAARGMALPADRAREELLRDEREKDLRATLSAAEIGEYQLRSSPTAFLVREDLAPMSDVTEAEFRIVFDLQRAFDEGAASAGGDDSRAARVAREKLKADIEAALGPERGPEYIDVTYELYMETSGLVGKLNLPRTNAAQIIRVYRQTWDRVEALRSDQSLNPADRAARLRELQAEAVGKVMPLLGGSEGLNEYRTRIEGSWLNAIAQ